jgi:hypothetical protein
MSKTDMTDTTNGTNGTNGTLAAFGAEEPDPERYGLNEGDSGWQDGFKENTR